MRYLIFILIFTASAAAGNIASRLAFENFVQTRAKKDAPFNHREHTGLLKCEDCHGYTSDGTFTGIPAAGNCLKCHSEFASKNIFANQNAPWESYAKQKADVYFSHKILMSARFADGRQKTDCFLCHANKADSWDTSMIVGRLSMDQCINCHKTLRLSKKCVVCH
ncbi:MAG: hypothetical protein FWG13_04560 [Leptospirales bacterium]|nr:hypothetical protein [Leptospirales bacterium]